MSFETLPKMARMRSEPHRGPSRSPVSGAAMTTPTSFVEHDPDE
jgi:hypothetical protein